MDSAVRKQIEELRAAPIAQIRTRYREVFEEEPRSKHREHLFRRLAWRLQALNEGGLSEAARQHATEIATEADIRVLPPPGFFADVAQAGADSRGSHGRFDRRIPRAGTVLKREYDGRIITVKVLIDGFEHEGRRYRSLSAIASEVTGTRWNGLAFFGLTGVRRMRKGGSRG
jgi:hypothetical protein